MTTVFYSVIVGDLSKEVDSENPSEWCKEASKDLREEHSKQSENKY